MKLVPWNCRGLGSIQKVKTLRDLIIIAKPNILLIQEIKTKEPEMLSLGNKIWKHNFGVACSASGTSSGINTFWLDSTTKFVNSIVF